MNFEKMSEKEILGIATPIMNNLMGASTEINYENHIKDFSDRLKSMFSKEYFQKVCTQYQAEKGFFTERQFVEIFKRPDSAAIIWKQFFSKAEGEFVAEMVLIHKDGEFLCDHVMVF